jgi:hypothetical protein
MKGQIALGLLALLALIGVTVAVTLGEQNRMTEFTRAYEARAIEAGATLFEDSCRPATPQGRGSRCGGDQRPRPVRQLRRQRSDGRTATCARRNRRRPPGAPVDESPSACPPGARPSAAPAR